jgi:uncharacterized protein YqeY
LIYSLPFFLKEENMGLMEKINEDLKAAMKSGDKIRLNTVRSIRAALLELEKSGKNKEITEEDEIKILTSAVKKRKEAIEQYRKGGREDLAEREEAELKIIEEYLPAQLSPEELEKEIRILAEEIGASSKADFAKLMPAAIKKFKGQADGKTIKETVEKILS